MFSSTALGKINYVVQPFKNEAERVKAVIFGAPGAGKGTYASRLQSRLNVDIIAMGDIFREMLKEDSELGRKIKGYVEKGLLVPDDIVNEVLKQRLTKVPPCKGFILDGYPRTVEQADTLESITRIEVVILLMVPDWIIIERLSSRRICRNCGTVYNIRFLKPKVEGACDKCGGELYQRSDDTPEVIKNRLQVYEVQTQPLLQKFREKNTPFVVAVCDKLDMPPETVVDAIVRDLERLKLI